ncbi:MAG: PD-(D/E)XK nuclease family protein, partial [Nocardioides sp.]|nr:PD-(D/E)XK nuclease family protein [Nocardioides sp.]
GRGGSDWRRNVALANSEDAGESLRLLYVAITRAQSQVVTWWAPGNNAKTSAFHRILMGRAPGEATVPDNAPLKSDDESQRFFTGWQGRGAAVWAPAIAVQLSDRALERPDDALSVRTFDRSVDTTWRRTSYSALTRLAESRPATVEVSSEPEQVPRDDEPEIAVVAPGGPGPEAMVVPSPMSDLPVGATFGSLVHGVLEEADPAAPDLRAEMLARIDEQVVRWPVELARGLLADALVAVCDSPLGPLAGDVTLRAIGRADRLCELDFELPLAGGDDSSYPTERVRLGDLAPLLRRHLGVDDPLLPFADALADPRLGEQDLRGYLTGSIDVVLRLRGTFLVVDYKTNWLGAFDELLTSQDYRPGVLAGAMGQSDYPLQALLYAVVLHRYLRWRLPGYDPATHLGGVLYLYVRGMCGPQTPTWDRHPAGVFSWQPPVRLVEELSDLLDGRLDGHLRGKGTA